VETRSHQRLKQLAVAFLREHGCVAVATEVQCPISRYRVDVAGYRDASRRRSRERAPALTVLVECKQSRAAFLRDRRDRERLLRQRTALDRFRCVLEDGRVRREEPELRREGTSLFPELEEWDYGASRLPAYRDVLRRLRRLDRMLHGQTKFCMAARYALADRLYLAAPRGMIKRRELPPGWGLLECSPRALAAADPNADLFGHSCLGVTVRAPILGPTEQRRLRLLRNIAVAASRAVAGRLGVLATGSPP
jgi:hypothetical protein